MSAESRSVVGFPEHPVHPETLDGLQEAVRARIEAGALANGWDVELSKWLAIIARYKTRGITPDQNDLGSSLRFLQSQNPDLGIVQDLRQRMMLHFWAADRGPTGCLVRLTGGGHPIPCVLIGLVAAFLITALIWFAFPLLWDDQPSRFMKKSEVIPLLCSAMFGAIAGQFARINQFGTLRAYHPLLVALNGFLKPLTTLILALALFAVIKTGIITVKSFDFSAAKPDEATLYAIWLIGFLAGFSERFAPDVVRRAEDAIAPPANRVPAG